MQRAADSFSRGGDYKNSHKAVKLNRLMVRARACLEYPNQVTTGKSDRDRSASSRGSVRGRWLLSKPALIARRKVATAAAASASDEETMARRLNMQARSYE